MQTDASAYKGYSDKPGDHAQMIKGNDKALFEATCVPDAGSQAGSPSRVAPLVRLDGSAAPKSSNRMNDGRPVAPLS
jgi:hypothetical protein